MYFILKLSVRLFFSGQNIRKPKNKCRCHSEAFWRIHHSVCWLTRARQFVKIQKAYIPNVLSCMSILKKNRGGRILYKPRQLITTPAGYLGTDLERVGGIPLQTHSPELCTLRRLICLHPYLQTPLPGNKQFCGRK